MTILIGGAPTGLLDSSHSLLGRNDQTSTATTDNGDALFVNVASGNLLYAHQDVYLPSLGEDYSLLRTYNSRGSSSTGGAFNDARWRNSTNVSLSALATAAGASARFQVRYGDNSVYEYALDAATGKYVSTDGTGAYETLGVLRDGAGAIVGYTVVRDDQTKLSFGPLGRLRRIEDTNGVFQAYTYDTNGRLSQVADDQGHVLRYAYNTNGRLVSVTDETGVVLVSYTFSGGRLASVTDRMGHVTRYFYDADGYLQRIELPAAQTVGAVAQSYAARVISFAYQTLTGAGVPPEGARVLTKITDAEGKATLFSYAFVLNKSGARTGQGTTTVTDALGRTMRFSYRADGAITQVIGQASTATSYEYDAAGNLLAVTDRNGFAVANRDSVYYRRLRAELGYVSSVTGLGKLVAELTDADKTALKALFTTRYTYDVRGNLLTSTDNAGNTTTYTYTAFNKLATITAANGGVTQFSYDAKQNLVKQIDPGGDVTRFTYDSFGNLKARVVYLDRADGAKEPADVAANKKQVTSYLYDAFGNNTQTIDAEGFRNSATYDHFGNMLTSTDARGNLSRYTYDADNRLVQLQDASGRKTLFAYDAVGNRIGLTTDWNGHTVTQVFDRNNRLISTIDAALDGDAARTRTTTVGYDDIGNRTSVTDAEGRTTTYTYNVRRELVGITSAAVDHDGDAATAAVQYTRTLAYDFEGNLITETDARGNATSYQYNRNGLLRLQTMADGQVTQYSYDKNQNLLSVVAGLQLEVSKRQTTTYAYDAENQLISVTDAKGNLSVYAYDAPGNVVQMTDAAGRISRMQYDRNNRLRVEVSAAVGVFDAVTGAAVIDPATGLQRTVSYTVEHRFDGNGNEIETIDQNGKRTLYAFDAVDRVSSLTDANGIVTTFAYDGNDNTTRVEIRGPGATEAASVSSYVYDEFDQLLAATDGVGNALVASDSAVYQSLRKELGYTVTEGATTRGKLVAELTDADKTALLAAFTHRYTYDKVGNLKTEVDHLGRTTSFAYDTLDRLVKSTDALGGTQQGRYDGNGNLLTETDELGRVTTYSYDKMDRVATRSDPLGSASASTVIKTVYDTFGNVTSLTEAAGTAQARTTRYEYDLNNLLTAAVDARGNRRSYAYDAVGNRIRETDARLNSTTFTYDALDRVVKVRDPLSFETRFEYDGVGNRIAMVDARGTRTRMEFDPGNRMTTMTDGEGRRTVFGYDALGNTITVTTAAGTTGAGALGAETTTYIYDAENNLRVVEDALGQRTTAGFDRVYNETSVTDARGNTTTTAFDALNRAVLVTDALGGTVRSTYDATGNVLSVKDENGSVTRYAYDRANQVITETDALGVETTYAYDAFGATTTITRAANRPGETRLQRFSYDANGNVTQETDAAGGIKAYLYDANNNLTRATDENGNATTYGYDANNRVITITDPLGGITRYSYDANGNRTVVEDAKGGKTTAYYNANNELSLTVDALGYATAYVYDANGNIIQTTRYAAPLSLPANPAVKPTPAVTSAEDRKTTFYFDANNQLTLSVDELGYATGYLYDAVGNVTQQTQYATALSLPVDLALEPTPATDAKDRTTTIHYDANNRQTRSVDAMGYVTDYGYDAVGNLTQQTLYSTIIGVPDRITTFYYDANNRLSLEVDAAGHATGYVYDAVGNVTQQTQYEAALTGYTPGTKPTPVTDARDRTTTFYYDANNRLTLTVDALGYATGYVYDAVGNVTQQTQYETALTGYTPGSKPAPATNAKDRTTNLSYDRLNRQIKVVDATGQGTRYFYDAFSNLIVVEDPNGVMTFNIYDVGNRLEYSVVAKPRSTITAQFPDGQVWGRVNLEAYFIPNFVNGFSANNGIKTSYTYDAANPAWVASTTVKFGDGTGTAAVMQYSHDLLGRITREQGTDGSYRAFRYDELGDVLELDDNGIVTLYTYDLLGRETSRTREQSAGTGTGNTETRSYDAAGNLVYTTDERGNATSYFYDGANRLERSLGAAGELTRYTYDAVGNVLSITNPGNGVQLFAYDAANRLVSSLSEGFYLTVYEYDAAGNETVRREYGLAYYVPENGPLPSPRFDDTSPRVTQSTWDSMNRLASRTDGDGLITTYSYDAAGNPTGSTTRTAATTARSEGTLGYDSNDRIIRQVDAAGVVTTYTLNAVGNVLVKVEAAGTATARTTTYTYDQGGARLRSETTAAGRLTRYEYEGGSDRLTRKTVEDAADATHTVLHEETWSYYANGELQLYVNAVGMRTVHTWEGGLKKSITYAEGTADAYTVTYSYDSKNRLVQEDTGVLFEGQMVSVRYAYDSNDNLTVKTEAVGIVGQERITRYAYDTQNRLIKMTDAENGITRYFYDALGNETIVQDPNGVMTFNLYDAGGRLDYSLSGKPDPAIYAQLPDGMQLTREYLEAAFVPYLTGFSARGGIKTSYTYDAAKPALVASKTVAFADGTGDVQTTSYTYDVQGRQATATDAEGFTTSFEYDAFGNLTKETKGQYLLPSSVQKTDAELWVSSDYDPAKPPLVEGNTYFNGARVWTAVGQYWIALGALSPEQSSGLNRAHPQTTTFVYDAADNLIQSVDGNGNATNATYDVLGYKQTVTIGVKTSTSTSRLHSFTTEYDWYADGTLKEQRDADGGITRIVRNSLGLQTRVSVLQRYGYESVYSGNGGYTVVQVEVGSITDFTYLIGKRLHTETQNSGTSTVVKTIAYDAFGNITGNTLASAQASYVRATSMRYDRLDRLVSQVDPMGGTTAYTYDAAGNLKSVTDANGAVTRYYYDDYNRLRAEIDAEGYLTDYTRDAFGNCIAKNLFSSKPGGVTDTAYTPPASTVDDRSTLFTFDGNNTLRTQTESSGLKKTWTYDGAGNLKTAVSSVTNAAQALKNLTESLADRTESWSYDNAGQRTGYVSVDGVVESFTYDSAGNQIQERITNLTRLASREFESVHITDYTYDAMNRLTSWDSGTLRRTFYYDFAGNKIEEQDGLNQATTYNYDLLNRLVEVRDAAGVKRGFSYHAYGQIETESVYDGDTQVLLHAYRYDASNRLITETGPMYDSYSVDAQGVGTTKANDRGVVSYAYDAVGNLKTRTDERGFVTTSWYDKRGSVIATLSGELILQRFSYNAFNELATLSTDRKPGAIYTLGVSRSSTTPPDPSDPIVITNTLDTMGHVIRTTYPLIDVTSVDPVTRAVTVTQAQPFEGSVYDAWGNLVRSTDRNGNISYAFFDARGRVTAAVDGDGYLSQTAYDSHGNVVLQTRYETPVVVSTAARPTSPASGQTQIVTRIYNAENQLIKEISPEVKTESGLLRANTTFLYDAAGNLVRKTFDIGADEQRSESYTYDNVNRLASVRSEGGVLNVLTRDYLGNVTSRYQYSNPEGLAVKNKFLDKETRYTYNRAGLLIRESEYVYGEDPASTENGEQWFSTLYSYDIAGNKTRKQVGDIDENGQMKPVAQSDGNVYARVFESFWRYNEAGKEILSAAADERRSYNAFFVAGARRFTEYDTSGRITKTWQVDPAAPTVQYKLFELEYNAIGAVINSNAGDGIWRQFGVDANGNKVVSRLTGTKNTTAGALVVYDVYDARGNNTRHVNEIGAITETVFDYLGRVTARKLPGALANSLNTTTYTYDSAGNLVSDVNPVGVSQTHYYNLRGQKVLSVFGEGNKQKWSYDSPTGHIYASWFEDAAGVLELSSVKYFRTDAFGRITGVIEGASGALAQAVADYDFDQRDNLRSAREIRAASNSAITESYYTRYWYDSRGNEILMQDGAGNFFGKHYNALGLVDEEGHWGRVPYQPIVSPVNWSTDPTNFSVFTGPSSKAAAFSTQYRTSFESRYDAFGNLLFTTVGRPEETRYDTYGRKTSKNTYGGARKVLSFQYDRFGRLEFETGTSTYKIFTGATLSSPSAAIYTQYQYDDAGRVIKIHDRALKTLTEYEYDFGNNITTEWFGDGADTNAIAIGQSVSNINKIRHTEATYDAGNRVSSQREWLSGFRVAYSYDLNNRISRRDTFYIEPGQFGQTQGAINLLDRFSFTYDAANRILNDGEYTYTYDSQGRRASALKNGETVATTYAYTNNGLLKSATKGTSVDTWTYDGAGNVASATIAGTATTYSRDAAGRVWKMVSGQTKTFSHLDDYGNAIQTCVFSDTADTGLTTDNADSQTWYINEDFDGDQAKSQGRVFSATGGGTVANAYVSYDAQGRRAKADESGVITTYEYDSAGNVLAVTDAGVTTRYLYSNGKRWGEYAVPTTGVATSFTAYSISRQPGAEFPSISTDRHTVQDGETLRSIAMQYFGSADLWYVIAEANGLTGTEALQRGDTLRIPATTANEYRTAGTFLPAKGLVGLVAPAPTAAEGDNCAQIAVIVAVVLVAIAAVALTIVTVGAAAPAAVTAIGATVTLGTAGAIAVGATVGVVIGAGIAFAASALTQYLLVSGGLQESWDWNQVAVDTAVGGLLGALAGGQAVYAAARAGQLAKVGVEIAKMSKPVKAALAISEVSLDVATEAASQAAQNNGRIPNPEYLGYAVAGTVGGELLGRGIGAIAKAVKKSRAVNAATAALAEGSPLRLADDPLLGRSYGEFLTKESGTENLEFLKATRNLQKLDPSSERAGLEAERIQRVFVRDGDDALDYRATPAQLEEFKARQLAGDVNTPVNLTSRTRATLLGLKPNSKEWLDVLKTADGEINQFGKTGLAPRFRKMVEEEQILPGYGSLEPGRLVRFAASAKAEAANRWRGTGEFFSARFSGAASALGSVRRGASARLDAAADVAAGVYASYKVKAGMKSASEAAAAAALRSQGLRRAADVEAFAAGDNYDPSILRRLLDDADLGPGMRKAIKDDYAEGKVKFLDDVSRLKSAAPDQRDAMARGMVDTYIRDLDVINLEAGYLEKFAKKFDDAGQQYSTGMFDVPEGQVAGLLKASASSSMTKFGKFRLSAATKDMAASLAEQQRSMLQSPLDRLAAASPMVRSKSAQNALSAGYFDNQAAARATEFARFNIENASSPGDQFYAAWDNPQLQKSVRDASSVGGKFQDETYVFALATRDYQRARLAGNAQGVTDALDKLSERITQRVSTPYAGGGFDDLNAPEEVLAVNMNQKADELFNRAIRNREYDVLDRTLPVAVNKLLAADSIRQADRFTNFGKFLNNNGLSGANLPNNPEVAEVNKLLGIFGS